MRERPVLIGSLAVVGAATGFGLLGVLSRFSDDAGLEPIPFVAWRAIFGILVLVAIIVVRARGGVAVVDPRRLARGDALGLAVVTAAGLGLNAGMFLGFDVTTIALVLLAFYTYPALVAVVAVALGHERLDPIRWLALGLALTGMVVVVAGGEAASPGSDRPNASNALGIGLGLFAAACQTVFVTVSRGRFRVLPSEQATTYVMAGTAVACVLGSLVAGSDLGVPLTSGRALVLVALTGVVAAGFPSVLFLIGLRLIGGTRAGILMLIEPLIGVTLAAAILGERLSPVQIAGAVAILGAALLLQRSPSGDRLPDRSSDPSTEPSGLPAGERT
jgi:drug/metabolite transporter (DMT)-like permease